MHGKLGKDDERDAAGIAPAAPVDSDSRTAALAAKARALDLLAYYLERLAKESTK